MTTLTEILCDVWDHCMTADEAREKIDDLFWNKLSKESSVEAAIEATKEKAAKAAKVCEETEYCSLTSEERPLYWFECAAAIRSMK